MSKASFGAGISAGIFLGIFLKTGIDASPEGISLTILQALGPMMVSFPTQLVIAVISIVSTAILFFQLKNDHAFLAGFLFGIFAVWISY